MNDSGNPDKTTSRGKVARLIAEHDLDDIGLELEERWIGESRERESLRDLADRFNEELLRARLDSKGMDMTEKEIEAMYRVLTDEQITGSRTQLIRRLERQGIDLEALESDFVSRQSIHTYLTRVRNVEHKKNTTDPIERDGQTIRQLRAKTETVTQDKLEHLREDNQLTLGDFRVTADVRVLCTDCGTQQDVNVLLREGGCDCGGGI